VRRAAFSSLLLTLLLPACVYYNGVYNARRLSRAAERAEREGRTIDARDLWAQVVVKADSVIARHPASEYVPQVELLRARALGRTDQCSEAAPALRQALPAVTDSAAVEAATFELARCLAVLGDVTGAADAYGRLRNATDPAMRNESRFQYVRALRLAGQYAAALEAASGLTDPRLPYERMVALAGTGPTAAAVALADSVIARADTAAPWDSLLSAGGRRDQPAISALVDRLVAMPTATAAMKSRWLFDDGIRLMSVDSARGEHRLAEAAASGGNTDFAGRARLLRTALALGRARSAADLAPVVDTLDALQSVTGARSEAAMLITPVTRVRAALDSAAASAPHADLALFLAAEAARDELATPALAEALFRRIVDERPDSPYAPKALLALHHLAPGAVPAFDSLISQRYAASPYVTALRGEAGPALRALEDSLSAFALTFGGASATTPSGVPGQTQTPGTRRPVEPQ
jgi:hypothetical protein